MKTIWSRERMEIIVIQNEREEANNDYCIIIVLRNLSFLRTKLFLPKKEIHFDGLENKLLHSTGRHIFSQKQMKISGIELLVKVWL